MNERQGLKRSRTSRDGYLAWRERAQSFDRMVACYSTTRFFAGQAEPESLSVVRVSPDYFELFAVKPAAGRFPRPEESEPGRNNAAVLSYGFWAGRFSRDPDVIGRSLRLDDSGYTVVGVAPGQFWFPADGTQIWTPFVARAAADSGDRDLTVLARL